MEDSRALQMMASYLSFGSYTFVKGLKMVVKLYILYLSGCNFDIRHCKFQFNIRFFKIAFENDTLLQN